MADPATTTVTTVLTRELLRVALGELLQLIFHWARDQVRLASPEQKYAMVAQIGQGYRDMVAALEQTEPQKVPTHGWLTRLVLKAQADFEAFRGEFATDMALQLPWVTPGLSEQLGIYAGVAQALTRAGVVLPFRAPGPRSKPVARPRRPPEQQGLPFDAPPGGGPPNEPPNELEQQPAPGVSGTGLAFALVGALVLVVAAGFAAGAS